MRGQELCEGVPGRFDPVIGDVSLHVVRVLFPVLARVWRRENGGRIGRRLGRGPRPGVGGRLAGGARQAGLVSEVRDRPFQA